MFLLVTSLATLATLLSPAAHSTYATGNCPGNEQQGTGTAPLTDKNKCYLNGQATANTPSGANPNTGNNQNGSTGGNNADNEGVTCAVEKIGWILCPIIEGSGKMADWAFDFLADNFLQVEPELLTSEPKGGNGKGTITAWEYARNIANVMFVIAFVVVIYSQITGAGLNNYGIKRMLPRLIIGALAVNVSYYICQAMVDLSNLLGYNIKDAMSDIANQIGPSVMGQSNQGTNTQTTSTGGVLTLIAVGALAVAGLIWVMLPILGSMIAFILITCIVIIIILLLRKAFIILLVVVSPIAFVMYLLPNTEKYFSKWLNMFWQLLMVFPIVALLLGAGQLASTIILVAGTSQGSTAQQSGENCDAQGNATNTNNNAPNQETVKTEGGYGVSGECTVNIGGLQSNWTLGLVAAGIAVAPLLAVWSVLQGALSAAGAIGGKISGAVQKGTAKGVGGAGKGLGKAKEGYKNSTVGQMRARSKKIREGEIRAGRYEGKGGRANPRNWRTSLNNKLNNIDRDPRYGNIPGVGDYGAQRRRENNKHDNEYMRDKAEEYANAQSYMAEFATAENDFRTATNDSDRHTADLKMRAAIAAAGRSYDDAGARDLRNRYHGRSGGGSAGGTGAGASGAAPAGANQGAGAGPRPIIRSNVSGASSGSGGGTVGSGGGAPSTNQPTSQQAARLSFNSLHNNRMFRNTGHDVLGQVANAGGWERVSDADVQAALAHAEHDINNGEMSQGQVDLYNQAVAEKQRRGIK